MYGSEGGKACEGLPILINSQLIVDKYEWVNERLTVLRVMLVKLNS